FSPSYLDRFWPHLASATWVFIDCNLPAATIAALMSRKQGARFKLAVDTVSSPKSARLPKDLTGIDLLFTNRDEA
ncbi:MAG: carbohydrate kinase, partial [Mesorhizobium sp.]